MLPILWDKPEFAPSSDPRLHPFCYLSLVPRDRLHPYGNTKGISDATDPLIEFMRPYVSDKTLVIGRLFCSDDVPELFRATRPVFHRLAEWVRSNWERLATGQYIGPEAQRLRADGFELLYFPPGVVVERKEVTTNADSAQSTGILE
jgi:hypothetical protein